MQDILPDGRDRPDREAIIAAVVAELDDYIDPPMIMGLTVPQSDPSLRAAIPRVATFVSLKEPSVLFWHQKAGRDLPKEPSLWE
jgi:hypothetical protein